jgi:hypothetical protein
MKNVKHFNTRSRRGQQKSPEKGGKCSGKKKAMEEVNGRVVYSSSRLSKVEKFFT